MKVAIVGAGIMGRLTALTLSQVPQLQLSLFDQHHFHTRLSCSQVAAGMIAPYVELENAEPLILSLGRQSLALWPKLLKLLNSQE